MAELNKLLRLGGVKRFVIWGLTKPIHSHFYIHNGFYSTLRKLGIPVIWLENEKLNNSKLKKDDFLIAVDVCINNLDLSDSYYYCFHNVSDSEKKNIKRNRYVNLQVLTNDAYPRFSCITNSLNLEGVSYFTEANSTLYQSWGTPYLSKEFLTPKYVTYKKYDFFVGSIWNNKFNQGNLTIIKQYKETLKNFGIDFVSIKGCSEFFNRIYVRNSAVAASIVGEWQRDNGYTPCRIFKAIAYGRLGIINSRLAINQYPWFFGNQSIDSLLETVLSMDKLKYFELVKYQQSFLEKETYECKLSNILKALIYVKKN